MCWGGHSPLETVASFLNFWWATGLSGTKSAHFLALGPVTPVARNPEILEDRLQMERWLLEKERSNFGGSDDQKIQSEMASGKERLWHFRRFFENILRKDAFVAIPAQLRNPV